MFGKVDHRNPDIDTELSHLNIKYKHTENGFYHEWNDIKTTLNASYVDRKKSIAFEGMVITSDTDFFKKLGWEKGEKPTKELKEYFDKCYEFAKKEIGYNGTDKNIISAVVHLDETTPHLQLYYLPITDKWQKKVYAKDENGKVLRTPKGTPIQAKDDKGKTIFEIVENKQEPKLSRTEFWRVRGGQTSYSQMQDRFHEQVGKAYNLERGEVGSDKVHRTKNEWEKEQLLAEKKKLIDEVKPYKKLKVGIDEVEHTGKSFLGITTIKTKDLEELKKQAKAFRVNRDDLIDVRAEKKALIKNNAELKQSIEQAKDIKQDYIEKYNEQLYINQRLEQTKNEISDLKAQIGDLRLENENLRESMAKLKTRLNDTLERFRDSIKAIGMLKYGDNDYKVENLNNKQSKLIDGISNVASRFMRKLGYADKADDMDKKVGLSKEIKQEITPSRSRGWDMER